MNFSDLIYSRLNDEKEKLSKQFTSEKLRYFYIDNLLPENIALEISNNFPALNKLTHNKTIRENKFIGVKFDSYHPTIKDLLFAFQEDKIIQLVQEITKIKSLEGDKTFYAAGISAMPKKSFLNPHLDNSHNADRSKYRVLNLLYYCEPDWQESNGGNLEIWPNKIKDNQQITIVSKFNRLVVMETNDQSWHSVSPIKIDKTRKCFSNYYFSNFSPTNDSYFQVTTFRGRPEQKIINLVLIVEGLLRQIIRTLKKRNAKSIKHIYK